MVVVRKDDGEGFEGVVALAPVLPQSGQRKWRSVLKRKEVGPLAVPGPLPLEPPIGGHQTPTRTEGGAE